MRLAASDTTATGSTTLLINSRLEITIRTMHSSAMRQMASTASITCRFAALREVTSRMTPTTLPWNTNGWDTAIMFSPVSGSHPRKGVISAVSMAWVMSPVPGDVPAVRPEVDTWMRPLLLMNCNSMRSLSSKESAACTALG